MLSEQKKIQAKNEAIEFLEYSILALCSSLGIDPDELDASFTNPVTSENPAYQSFESLKRQVLIHYDLTNGAQ